MGLCALLTSMVALSIDSMLPALTTIGSELGAGSENRAQFDKRDTKANLRRSPEHVAQPGSVRRQPIEGGGIPPETVNASGQRKISFQTARCCGREEQKKKRRAHHERPHQ